MDKIESCPLSLKEANDFVDEVHRHHMSVVRDKYRIGASVNGKLVGVVQVGRPVSRMLDDGQTLEVLRLASDGTRNVCSFLYSASARVGKELGYKQMITYILETEDGASLRAAGWSQDEGKFGGGEWTRESRKRDTEKYPICKKKRYRKILK